MLQDEISSLEKELVAKKEEFEQTTKMREAELKEREEVVAQAEKEIVGLQVKVDNFPNEMEKAINKAVKEVTGRLNAEAANNLELQGKTFEGEKNVLSTRIQALDQLSAEQKKQIELLSAQLEKAYGKVQDIAVQAVSAPRERHVETGARTGIQKDAK